MIVSSVGHGSPCQYIASLKFSRALTGLYCPLRVRLETGRTFKDVFCSFVLLSYDPMVPLSACLSKKISLTTEINITCRNPSTKLRLYHSCVVRKLALSLTTTVLIRSRYADLNALAVRVVVEWSIEDVREPSVGFGGP